MNLRPYQGEAHDKVIKHIIKSLDPCLVNAPTGSGKSHIIAAIANTLTEKSDKKILCIAPSRELVLQNHAKYTATGNDASIYSASINKSLRHKVVFGTPLTIANDLKHFKMEFCAVVIDECHKTTKSILDIIDKLRFINPNLRIIGLTATPFRMNDGCIYGHGKMYTCVYSIDPYKLIEQGYLCDTKVIYPTDGNYYETIGFKVQKNGSFKSSDLMTIESAHEKTSNIIHDVMTVSSQRKGSTIIFACTVKHAYECFGMLPDGQAGIITAKTKKKEREKTIDDFKNGLLKYIVNVDALTTGFDASNIDTIAFLRATESKSLLQQMIGRGLRIHPGKTECLILDYAENIKRHCEDDRDIWTIISEEERKKNEDENTIEVRCPKCSSSNFFTAAYNPNNLKSNQHGYFELPNGVELLVASHMGRRCGYVDDDGERCDYRWVFKVCTKCKAENDITASHCELCGHELISPDKNLKYIDSEYELKVKDWEIRTAKSKKNRDLVIVDLMDDHDKKLTLFFISDSNPRLEPWLHNKFVSFRNATDNFRVKPSAIKYGISKGFVNVKEVIL